MSNPDFEIKADSGSYPAEESLAEEPPAEKSPAEEPLVESPSIQNAPSKSRTVHPSTKLISETVVHRKAPLPSSILNRLERQKLKYWHFQFKDSNDLENVKNKIRNNDSSITVEHNYQGKKHPDLIISKDGSPIGKLHFLYCNRPDICDPNLFYVKVHYYDFNSDSLLERVKEIMSNVFNTMASTQGGKGRAKKRPTRKRALKRKMRRTRKN